MSHQRASAFPLENLIPLLAGLTWIVWSTESGALRLLLGIVPGTLMLSGAISIYLLPGDLRAPQLIAMGALVGLICTLPLVLLEGFAETAMLGVLAAASFVAGGWTAHRREPLYPRVPEPPLDLTLATKVGLDQLALASMFVRRQDALGVHVPRHAAEVAAAMAMFDDQGWLEKPEQYHREPPALESPTLVTRNIGRRYRLEHLSFDSGFEMHEGEPGRDRWSNYLPNRTAHAWVLRSGEPGPWLICAHGYGMGTPRIDLGAFEATRLQRAHGLNLIFPVLPLHGPRKIAFRSGDGYLSGDFMNTIHAHAQAAWDIRRMMTWLRSEGATSIGAYGLSLGGGVTALLASLEQDLSCAILGIPAVDIARAVRRQASPAALREMANEGLEWDDLERLVGVISSMALTPKIPKDRRYIFAGTADHLIPPDQVRDLWRHWEEPRIAWYPGSHISFSREQEVRFLVDDALRDL